MADFLPPVVTSLKGDISDLISDIEKAKALIKSIGDTTVKVRVDVSGISGPVRGAIAQIEALKAAMAGLDNKSIRISVDGAGAAAATTAATGGGGGRGGGRGIWWLGGLGWLGLHNIMITLGSQIIADTAGMIAFGAAAAATLGPVFSGYSKLQTSYATMDNYQKAAALSLNRFLEGFHNSNEAGVVTVFNEGLNLVNSTLHKSGSITSQATQAFIQFGAMLHTTVTGPAWQSVFGSATGNVRADMTALFGLVNSLVGVMPALIKDFNGFGLTAIHAVSGVINGISFLSDNVIGRATLRFGALGIAAYKSMQWFAKTGLGTRLGLAGLGASGAGALGLGVGALAAEFYYLNKLPTAAQQYQNSLIQQNSSLTQTTQGWQQLAQSMKNYAQQKLVFFTGGAPGVLGTGVPHMERGYGEVYANTVGSAQALAAQDAQNAKMLAANLTYLSSTYGMSSQQANQFASVTGVKLTQALQGSSTAAQQARFTLQAYIATTQGAANPTAVLAVQMMLLKQDAGNLTKQGQDLTAMFNTLATPFSNTITATVTWKQGNAALAQALKASGDKAGYSTVAQQNSAAALAKSINSTEGLSSAILAQTGSYQKSFGPVQQEINFLKSLHSHSKLVADAIRILQQYIDQLHGKTISINVTGNGIGLLGSLTRAGGGGVTLVTTPGGNTALRGSGYASGTSSAAPGWAWVGERGKELVHFSGGEKVIPHHIATGYANGAGVPVSDNRPIELRVYLDGEELFAKIKSSTWDYNTANNNRSRGGRVRGTMVPRG